MLAASPAVIQACSTVRVAVGNALRTAARALAGGEADALTVAHTQWQAAHAALRVVNHKGLVQFSQELGVVITGANASQPVAIKAVSTGVDALTQYMDELIAGRRDQPLRMLPAYREVLRARGVEQPSDSDLFFPDLTVGPGDRADAMAMTQDALRATRRRLETGLLQWLRKADDPAGLQQVQEAVAAVEAAQSTNQDRALWWVARAVLDAVASGGLSADNAIRRFVTQLNLHLGRMVQGPAAVPETLLRDALYLAARAQPVTALVEEVQKTCGLRGALDVDEGVTAGFSADAVTAARRDNEGLQEQWIACAEGQGDIGAFAARVQALEKSVQALGQPALTAVVAQLAAGAQIIAANVPSGQKMSESAALEGACALLMIPHVLDAGKAPDAGFAQRAQNMVARLKVSVEAPDALRALPAAQLLDDDGQRAQAQELIALVQGEVTRGLRGVEEGLDGWFRDPAKVEVLRPLDKPLAQAAGAFAVLGERDAAGLTRQCRTEIAGYAAGANCDASARELLAKRLTALSAVAGTPGLGQGVPVAADILARMGLSAGTVAPAAAPASVPDMAPVSQTVPATPVAAPAEPPATAVTAAAVATIDGGPDTDPEMLEIFLEEAGEVLGTIATTLPESRKTPEDQELLTTLRRAFHTLKGSGRMIGLKNFGEAAWEMEQVFNEMSPMRKPGTPDLYRLVEYAHGNFESWIAEFRAQKRVNIDALQLADWAKKMRAGEPLPSDSGIAPAAQQAEPAVQKSSPPVPAVADDTIVIGDLRISRQLYDIFLPEAQSYAAALADHNRRVQAGEKVDGEFLRAVHTLSGISGTSGFAMVRNVGASLERVLQSAMDRDVAPRDEARELIARATAALAEQIGRIAAREKPDDDAELTASLDAMVPRVGEIVPEPAPQPAAEAASRPVSLAPSDDAEGIERRRSRLNDDVDSQLLPIFLAEAQELVPQVGQDLRDWRARPDDKLVSQSLKRLLHTLKGSARMAGAMALGQLTHSMESRVENAALLPVVPDSLFDDLETSFDRIGVLIESLQGAELPDGAMDEAGELPEAIDQMAKSMRIATATTMMPAAQPVAPTAEAPALPAQSEAVVNVQRPLIRVRADLIDRLANQAGEISIARARVSAELRSARGTLRDLSENIGRLRTQLRELEIQAETQMQSRFSPSPERADGKFDPLEFDRFTRLQELTRLMAESVNDVATVQQNLARDLDEGEKALAAQAQMTRDVQQDLMAIRMVPFSSLSDRLYRVTRLAAKDSDKRVQLEMKGGHAELDRGVLDRISAPLEHLLRNAIAHGIEAPQRRREAGKAEAGEIMLEVRQEGNEIVLVLADDGAGLNIERIRNKAIGLGLMRTDETLSDQQIGNFIFRSGFSTAGEVTAMAGRGVGMDVVMSEISGLGGRVGTAFERGKGTTFTIHLPLTLSVLQGVVLRLDSNLYAVPTMMVEQLQRLKQEVVAAAHSAGKIEWQGQEYPFHPLRELMELPPGDMEPGRFGSVVLLRSGNYRAAIQVDDIVGGQEIVIKNTGPQLARVPGVTGAAVLGSGETVLILNPVQLAMRAEEKSRLAASVRGERSVSSASDSPAAPDSQAVLTAPQRQRMVLVVDDSLTVRKITGRLLTREGYQVEVAKDGVEALEKMQGLRPDLMITDVEMPRMDGFDLTRNVRADEKLKGMPIVMITSRTAEKHREQAVELGVDVFLGKPYEEGDLLRNIAGLLNRPQAASAPTPMTPEAPVMETQADANAAPAPVAETEHVPAPVHEEHRPAPVHEPARQTLVLVVDDSLTVRKITGRFLEREGFKVAVARDGVDALEKLQVERPDVMITDVEMPRMDGFDLTRNVRADGKLKGLPIIMITSRTADKHREHASELGVDVFLGKPYEEGELLKHIKALAARPIPV